MYKLMKENLYDLGASDFVLGTYETYEQAKSALDTHIGSPTYCLLYIVCNK